MPLRTSAGTRGYAATAWTWGCSRGPAACVRLARGASTQAAAEEVEARPAKHLALQHFEAVAYAPRQGPHSRAASPQL